VQPAHRRTIRVTASGPTSGRTWAAVLAVLTVLTASAAGNFPASAQTAPPAAGATAAGPPTPAGLPTALEALSGYVPANSCDPHSKLGALAFGDLLRTAYPGSSYGASRACGTSPLPTSEHYDGRAIDWFRSVRTPAQKADAQAALTWLIAVDKTGNRYANARRLGVMYIIWNNKIWASYRTGDGWRPYSTCATHPSAAYDTTCHRDHVHFSLSWEGAMKRTSYWTKSVAAVDYGPCRAPDLNWAHPYSTARTTPCPNYPKVTAPASSSALHRSLTTYSGMRLRTGSTGPSVRAVQSIVGASADGNFGPVTATAVRSWQTRHNITASGVIYYATWRALLKATK
jgi:hypothetical protein